eukprot:gnl/TRDRNA2_/TRDRNA2_177355_c1_seq28.p1 gnl/TRDRNA2_/TRDRNA2_177355_c1~~gnl/TRDRNA2_/TRDRNA2_177355_c1_seq28.p1  ORF type:complete len:730 (+),score=51.14 gnl/TRDRNA2_/TRDRNA2_177355_c1_seq28:877-3066(+)
MIGAEQFFKLRDSVPVLDYGCLLLASLKFRWQIAGLKTKDILRNLKVAIRDNVFDAIHVMMTTANFLKGMVAPRFQTQAIAVLTEIKSAVDSMEQSSGSSDINEDTINHTHVEKEEVQSVSAVGHDLVFNKLLVRNESTGEVDLRPRYEYDVFYRTESEHFPPTDASYISPHHVDEVLAELGLSEDKLPKKGGVADVEKRMCLDCGKSIPQIARHNLRTMLRRSEDNDPMPMERVSGKQQLMLFSFGAMPTSSLPWWSNLTDDKCIPGWRVVTTGHGAGTDGADLHTPCRHLPDDDNRGFGFLLSAAINGFLSKIKGSGICSMKGKVLWDVASGSGSWNGAAGHLMPYDLLRRDGLGIEALREWAEELRLPPWSPSMFLREDAYYRQELLHILLSRTTEIEDPGGIELPINAHEIKLGSFKHPYMNVAQIQADGEGLAAHQCGSDLYKYESQWGPITAWPLGGVNDQQMMGLATSNPEMFYLHTAYSLALNKESLPHINAGMVLMHYLTSIMYFGRPKLFIAGAKMIGWNHVMSAIKPLPNPECMNEHGYPRAQIPACRKLMTKEFFVLHLIQHPQTFNCILAFRGTLTRNDNEKLEQHFRWPAERFCGNRVHRGVAQHVRALTNTTNFQKMRTYLPKCRNVAAVGHSLGGSDAEVFMGCLHTEGRGDSKADYDKLSWEMNQEPGLLPTAPEGDIDCDPAIHKAGVCGSDVKTTLTASTTPSTSVSPTP